MTLPLSGESTPPPGLPGLVAGMPDAQPNESPAGNREASFDDTLASLVDGRWAAEPPSEATLPLFDSALLLEWQLRGWDPPAETAGAHANEGSQPDGGTAGDDPTPEEMGLAMTAFPGAPAELPSAAPYTPVPTGPHTGATPAAPVDSQDPAGIRLVNPAADSPVTGPAPAAAGVASQQAAAVGSAATPAAGFPVAPDAGRAEPFPEPVQAPAGTGQASTIPTTPPTAATAAASPAIQARAAADAAPAAVRGDSTPEVMGEAAVPAAAPAGSAFEHGAADSGSGGPSPESQTPPSPQLSSAGRRFAARIEEFATDSDRQPAAATRAVAAEGPAPAPPRAAVVTAPAPAAPAAEPTAESFERLVQSIRIQVRQGVSEATIRLQPEHLGEVTISIRLDRGAVSAVINAEGGDVCEWLRGQEDAIRRSLFEQGMQLERFLVQRDGSRERREPPPQHEQAATPREPGDDTPRFEVAA